MNVICKDANISELENARDKLLVIVDDLYSEGRILRADGLNDVIRRLDVFINTMRTSEEKWRLRRIA